MRAAFLGLVLAIAGVSASAALGQATTRPCTSNEAVGPACLIAHQDLTALPAGPVFWHLETFKSRKAAEQGAGQNSRVVTAYGKTWLFTIAPRKWCSKGGRHLAAIGPLALEPAPAYSVHYLRAIFTRRV